MFDVTPPPQWRPTGPGAPATARPAAVGTAGWVMFAAAIIHLLGAGYLFLTAAARARWHAVTAYPEFNAALWMVAFGIGAIVCAIGVRRGSDVARSGAFTVLGAAAIAWLAGEVEQVARFIFSEHADRVALLIVGLLAFAIGFTIVVLPIPLLAGTKSAHWFHQRAPRPVDPGRRPVPSLVAMVTLTLVVVLEVIDTVASPTRHLYKDLDGADVSTAAFLTPYLAFAAIPMFIAITAVVGLALGSDFARVLALGATGFFIYNGCYYLWAYLAYSDIGASFDRIFVIGLLLAVTGALAAALTLVCLLVPAVSRWYGWRRFEA